MPTFPTYDGELPSCLNPWNPRHYLLVLYWVFFRPTALKCYLYRSNPEIYRKDSRWSYLVEIIQNTEYRNLFCISLILILLTSLIVSSPIHWLQQKVTIQELEQIAKLCLKEEFREQFASTCSQANLNISIYIPPYLFPDKNFYESKFTIEKIFKWGFNESANIARLLASLMPILIVGSLLINLIRKCSPAKYIFVMISDGMTLCVTFSMLLGSAIYLSPGRPSNVPQLPGITDYTSLWILIIVGLLFSIISSKLRVLSLAYAVSAGIFSAVSFSKTNPIDLGSILYYVITTLFFLLIPLAAGFLRLPFYFIEIFGCFHSRRLGSTHPILWDEFNILPLPWSSKYLLSKLKLDGSRGLSEISQIISNPFKSWVIQRTAWSYLESSRSPIETIYSWATANELERYAQAPIHSHDWEQNISCRKMLFCIIGDFPSDCKGKHESFAFNTTSILRKKAPDILRGLMTLFFRIDLFERFEIELDSPESELDVYPYGSEVRKSLHAIFNYLEFHNIEDISTAPEYSSWIKTTDQFLRPKIIDTLQNLRTVSQEIHRSIIATSRTNRLSAIALANDRLDQLQTYITEEVPNGYPEHKLLLRITRQWQKIITQAGGTAARQQLLTPVSNPYVAGNPVTGKLFVGRDDILTRIEELWTQPDQISSIVLYGHRRMGKTSILRNLPGRFGPHTHIIDFNLQRVGMIDQLADLIYRLAIELHDALPATIQTHIPEPTEDQYYNTHNPTTQLDRLLKQIQTHRQNDRFILAIDEFEILEDLITQGKIEPTIIAYLRALIQTYPWFILIFAGLHTLQEMTENYWNPLFGSVTRIPVSTLTTAAARELITNPTDDFPLDYDQDAIDRIIQLSGGQPYLTQLLCQSLITRFNRIRFEERHEIEPRFTLQDVETIIANPNFYRDGNAYFSAIWDQAQETHAPAQHAILRLLAPHPLTLTDLTQAIPQPLLFPALQTLISHDVITEEHDRYTYRIELLRTWVNRTQRS